MYRYVGTDRNGTARTGVTADQAAFAEQCFKRGWLWLRILASEDEREVGGITFNADRPKRRIWWAESAEPTDPSAFPTPTPEGSNQ